MSILIYPYDTLREGLDLRVALHQVDGQAPDEDYVSPEQKLVDLAAIAGKWTTAALIVVVRAPEDVVKRLTSTPSVVLSLGCGPTNLRTSTKLLADPLEAGTWRGKIMVDKRALRGSAELTALLVGQSAGRDHRLLGTGPAWKLQVDDPAFLAIEGTLRVRWADFTKATAPEVVRPYPNEAYYLDLLGSPPYLYLNSSITGLQQLLEDRRRREPAEQALYEVERMSIAQPCWMALFAASVASILQNEDDPEEEAGWPAEHWQKQILERLLLKIYDNMTLGDALSKAAKARLSPVDSRFLESKALSAIGVELNAGRALRRSLDSFYSRDGK